MNWSGNVRELRNAVTKLAITVAHDSISAEDVGQCHGHEPTREGGLSPNFPERSTTILEMERRMIVRALEATGGNQSRAAQQLGMPRRTFCRKLDEYQITWAGAEPANPPLQRWRAIACNSGSGKLRPRAARTLTQKPLMSASEALD